MVKRDYECRYQAIKEFMEKKGNDYLRMVEKTERMLMFALGKDFIKTNKPEEMLHEVFGDLIDGTRPWDMDKHSLEQVVNQNLRSEISNLAKKEKRYVIIKDFFDEDNEDDNYNTEMDKLVHTQAEDIEGKMDAEAILTFCNDKILKDDEDGKIVLDEMLQGKKQKDIASYLGITVEEAEVHIRRIRRKIRAELPSSLLKNIPENLINKMPNNKRSNAYDKKQIKHIIKPIPG